MGLGLGSAACGWERGSAEEESEGRESAEERWAAWEGSWILVNWAGLGGAALVGIFWRGSLRRLGGALAIEVVLMVR